MERSLVSRIRSCQRPCAHGGRNLPIERHAHSFKRIAETHGEGFYRDDLAEYIVASARQYGVSFDKRDFAGLTNEWCGIILQDFQSAALHEIPPNGQGIAALNALGIIKAAGVLDVSPHSADSVHIQIEAVKIVSSDVYAYAADPDHMSYVRPADLLDPSYLASRAGLIDRFARRNFPLALLDTAALSAWPQEMQTG